MLTEREILDLLSEHLDNRLDAPTREAVDLGLARSAQLRSALTGLRRTAALLAGLPRVNAPAGFAEETAAKAARIVMLNRAGRQMVARRGRSVMWGRAASIAAVLALCSLAAVAVWRAQNRIVENNEPALAWNRTSAPTPDAENGAAPVGAERLRKSVEGDAPFGFTEVPKTGETRAATPPPAPEPPAPERSADLIRVRPERANMELHYRWPDDSGRLHISLQPVIRGRDGKEVLQLTLVARGAPKSLDEEGVFKCLDHGREWIVRGFADFTTESMQRSIWEKR